MDHYTTFSSHAGSVLMGLKAHEIGIWRPVETRVDIQQKTVGLETSIKGSKEGLGLTKRNKKRFLTQEMLVLLAQLAYNFITWMRNQLARHVPFWKGNGILRLVRDAFHINGKICLDSQSVRLWA